MISLFRIAIVLGRKITRFCVFTIKNMAQNEKSILNKHFIK